MKTSETVAKIQAALIKAQSEMTGAVKDSANPFFKSNYADLTSVIKAIKEAWTNNKIGYAQFPISTEQGVGVQTRLMHESGEWIEHEFVLPLPKYDPQSAGSAITYARRYALQAIAGIPSVDDDAELAMSRHVVDTHITVTEFNAMKKLLDETEADIEGFCKAFQCDKPENIMKSRYDNAMSTLKRKKEQQNGKHDKASESSGQGRQATQDQSAEVLDKLRKDIRGQEK